MKKWIYEGEVYGLWSNGNEFREKRRDGREEREEEVSYLT